MNRETKKIISPDTKRKNRVPPGQFISKSKKWPALHIEPPPEFNPDSWELKITGLVENDISLSYDSLKELPQSQVYADFHCVTTFSILNNLWSGIRTLDIRDIINISPEAKAVMLYAPGKYSTNILIEDFFDDDVILAQGLNGKPLTIEQGFPLRLIVPKLYAYKSIKWVNKIEFLKENKPGYWELRGYHNHADPWKEERFS